MTKQKSDEKKEEDIPPYLQLMLLGMLGVVIASFIHRWGIPPWIVGIFLGVYGIVVLLQYPQVWRKKDNYRARIQKKKDEKR